MQKTTMLKKAEAQASRKWYCVDATDLVLGKLAVKAADLLRGKNKVNFTPNQDCGDYLIIINSDKVKLSGNKLDNEFWYRHSGYIGGIKSRSGREMVQNYSDKLVYNAVKGMLPDNRISKQIIRKLKVYKDANHGHEAQQPNLLNWKKDSK